METGSRVLALLGPVLLGACSEPPVVVPTALLGTWVTDVPTHADRRFVVRADAIVFGTSAYSHENYSLVQVEPREQSGGWQTYRIAFRELDAEVAEIEVALRAGTPPALRFKNQSGIWRPEGAMPEPKAPSPRKKRMPNDGLLMEPTDE